MGRVVVSAIMTNDGPRYFTTTTTDTSDSGVLTPSELTTAAWPTTNVILVSDPPPTVNVKRTVMTANFYDDSSRSMCGFCRGRKYDPKHRGASRKCQRCRGQGYTIFCRIKR
jgi:hypothetical protein